MNLQQALNPVVSSQRYFAECFVYLLRWDQKINPAARFIQGSCKVLFGANIIIENIAVKLLNYVLLFFYGLFYYRQSNNLMPLL